MESVLMEKYRPGIQNGHDGGVHLEGDFGDDNYKGKLIIICHHNRSTFGVKGNLKSAEITIEPSFTEPAKKFLVGKDIPEGGVYYYRANKNGNDPHFYAGKARNLLARAGDKVRISDKDFVVLIRKDSMDMDENWQTHLEHLMYEDLKEREGRGEVTVLNKDSISASLCSQEEKKIIRKFFRAMIECLNDLEAWSKF